MPPAPAHTPLFRPHFSKMTLARPSPIPQRSASTSTTDTENVESSVDSRIKPDPMFPLPKLRLEVRDLIHPGSRAFLASVVPTTAVEFAVRRSLDLLYVGPECPTTTVPGTRSITLILRSMGGVAYSTGVELDDDHKEIHFSVEYISNIPQSRLVDEILGVLTHEVVHCYQYNADGTCPGGLIEGIADWVRLNSNLIPPHWKREASGEWDAGYHHTAYFLEYLEQRYGCGTMSRMNEKLRTGSYEEKQFWTELLGRTVGQLWDDYAEDLKKEISILKRSTSSPQTAANDEEMVMPKKMTPERTRN